MVLKEEMDDGQTNGQCDKGLLQRRTAVASLNLRAPSDTPKNVG